LQAVVCGKLEPGGDIDWPHDNDPLLELLAEDAWAETILNKDVLA
jgi:hypothetical protein